MLPSADEVEAGANERRCSSNPAATRPGSCVPVLLPEQEEPEAQARPDAAYEIA